MKDVFTITSTKQTDVFTVTGIYNFNNKINYVQHGIIYNFKTTGMYYNFKTNYGHYRDVLQLQNEHIQIYRFCETVKNMCIYVKKGECIMFISL